MEGKNSNLLLTPVAKKNCNFTREYLLSMVASQGKENKSDPNRKVAVGYLQDNYVLVHGEESMKRLFWMGFFGKGTLSKQAPKICFQQNVIEPEKEMQRFATNSPMDNLMDVDSDDESPKPKKFKASHEDEVLISDSSVMEDCGNEDNLEQSDSEGKESLQLSFQEAFFLSHGLKSLIVKYNDKMLSVPALWAKFCERTPSGNFPAMYTAYHHFRRKGWVVKNGLKVGTDYVLYKDGSLFYHATYSVIVRTLKEDLTDARGNRELTWASLAALNRLTTTLGKGLLILYVIKPNRMTESVLSTPSCISQFKVEEVLHKQWWAMESKEEGL